MSERHIPKFENQESSQLNNEKLKEHNERLREDREKSAEQAEKDKPSIEKIRESIEKSAAGKDEVLKPSKGEGTDGEAPVYTSLNLRKNAAKQMQRRIQKQLPRTDRAFSKVIHQPAVEAVSNAAEGTVARPSGLLFGGICSVISSLAILYICRHYGYEYNFLIGLVFFAGGFIVGILLEGIYKIFKRS